MVEYDNMTVLITAVLCYDLCWMVVLGFLSQPFTFVTQVATPHNTTQHTDAIPGVVQVLSIRGAGPESHFQGTFIVKVKFGCSSMTSPQLT